MFCFFKLIIYSEDRKREEEEEGGGDGEGGFIPSTVLAQSIFAVVHEAPAPHSCLHAPLTPLQPKPEPHLLLRLLLSTVTGGE